MYVPTVYQDGRYAPSAEIIRCNPLALVVTSAAVGPIATHAPVVFRAAAPAIEGDESQLVGATLIGHMNVQNPQWQAMSDGERALIIFQGPHGYVSPAVYGVTPAAPTWDFCAVHLLGTMRLIAGQEAVLDIVRLTVRELEGRFGRGWDMTESLEYFRKLAPGVGAFEFRVDSVQSMFKLSQEQRPELRERVIEEFEASPAGTHRDLARAIRAWPASESDDERGECP
jgi:transcriptional regulator